MFDSMLLYFIVGKPVKCCIRGLWSFRNSFPPKGNSFGVCVWHAFTTNTVFPAANITFQRRQLENLQERQGERKRGEKKKLWLYFYSLNSSPLWKTPPGKLTIHITDNTVKLDHLNKQKWFNWLISLIPYLQTLLPSPILKNKQRA